MSEPLVVLYTTSVATSPNIRSATARIKLILDANGVKYDEVDLILQQERRDDMLKASNGVKILPQLHINGRYIGSVDTVQELQDSQELASLLKPPVH
ncbi:hypothetical protein CEUSTIGMA_g13797.t1 [Chlamydomonas eustigma]|uniref:Uncharacterized protein n=1 Tax=Chlamydomonas eustigma TaxID=1157962 RepID=A0A250XRC5_9CHLO|nr:hypothetical protein CEUSTIGMA_g12978.t1 [Chlamydomonas eustigma]GAX86385.1 hypothetical protein CEUSTIGMA_g13797.t1 [Chlamydomonas eustigma]|eukprot:GAX85563.1 hypothetical protein CEUSTIGMA_g12978.t1 [Chlamydomonas eustigma]